MYRQFTLFKKYSRASSRGEKRKHTLATSGIFTLFIFIYFDLSLFHVPVKLQSKNPHPFFSNQRPPHKNTKPRKRTRGTRPN